MKLEIVATGDEIRSGSLIDTNSAYIAERLEREGLVVTRHHCLGDDINALSDVFKEIATRADCAVVTGGLGPTEDDLTAAAMAKAADLVLTEDHIALAAIEAYFSSQNRHMPPSNRKQAQFPEGSEVLSNPMGTAPGFSVCMDDCRFYCLPGVPREMRKMLADEVIPRLRRQLGKKRSHSIIRVLPTFGSTESMIGERLVGVTADTTGVQLGLRAKFPEIQVRLYGRGDSEKQVTEQLDCVSQKVVERLGNIVFSREGRSMAAEVGRLLIEKNATVALAESCTGGLIAHMLTNVSGSSAFFLFSGVTYANQAKTDILDVSQHTIIAHGAVSPQTVEQMASGTRQATHATYGLSTSGIAGPDGGSDEKPVGTVCIGLADKNGANGCQLYFPYGERLAKKKLFAMAALDTLRRHIMGIEGLDFPSKKD